MILSSENITNKIKTKNYDCFKKFLGSWEFPGLQKYCYWTYWKKMPNWGFLSLITKKEKKTIRLP